MKITIVKTSAGTVLIQDFNTKFVYKELQEVASLVLSDEDKYLSNTEEAGAIEIVDRTSQSYILKYADVVNTQILPALPVDFTGSLKDLYELLEADFFYNILNPPTAGGVNIYNSDGSLTGDRVLNGSNFNLSLIGINELVKSYTTKEEIIGDQKILTIGYDLTLNGNTAQNLILIPLLADFDTAAVFGRVIYREASVDGSGRVNFYSSCTRNIGGVLELDNINVQAFQYSSITGLNPQIGHTTAGTNYIITINPRSLVNNVRFFVWLELHCANILV
jgi:hypothetical protein